LRVDVGGGQRFVFGAGHFRFSVGLDCPLMKKNISPFFLIRNSFFLHKRVFFAGLRIASGIVKL
jgi:hypothetical protein